MSAWGPALAPGLVAVLVLLVPGLLVGRAAGLRGIVWCGAAPALSVSVCAVAAVLAPAAGLRWGMLPVALGTLVALVPAAGVGLLAGARRAGWRPASPTRRDLAVAAAAIGGLLLGGLLALRRLLRALGGPHGVSQSYDAPFHLNAVRWVLDSGDASSLHVNRLVTPVGPPGFYPAAWHGIVALAAGSTGAAVDVATNATAVVVAVVVWPLAALALVRALLGRRPLALAAAGALTAAFLAQPLVPLEWGVLYPTVLTNAVLPAALALLVLAADRSRPARTRVALLLVLTGVLPGMALAQPSGLFALAAIALPLAVGVLAGWARRRWERPGQRPVVAGGVLLAVLAAVVAWHVVDTSASVVSARGTDWAAQARPAAAVWQAVGGGYLNRPAVPVTAVLVLIGAVVALRRPRWRWLVVAHVLVSTLYVLDWSVDSDLVQTLTGFWYNDAYRLAELPVLTGVVLASAGVLGVASAVRRVLQQVRPAGWAGPAVGARLAVGAGPARRPGWVPVQLVAGALAVLAVLAGARGPAFVRGYQALSDNFTNSPDTVLSDLLDADERALVDRVDAVVPPGTAVAGNPWNGSALVYALAGRPTPFPHMTSRFDAPREVVAAHLRDAATDPAVCPAVRALHLGYVLDLGGYHLWGGDPGGRDAVYPGLAGVGDVPGFALVDSQGPDARLYRITACG